MYGSGTKEAINEILHWRQEWQAAKSRVVESLGKHFIEAMDKALHRELVRRMDRPEQIGIDDNVIEDSGTGQVGWDKVHWPLIRNGF